MGRFSLISEYANSISDFGGFTTRTKKHVVEARLLDVLRSMKAEGILTPSEWAGFDAIWYGINWYVQTGRATAEIEAELKALTGKQLIRLIVKMWLDGCNTSGDAGDWLRDRKGCYARLSR